MLNLAGPALERALGLPAGRYPKVVLSPDAPVEMSDGVSLATDVYRPVGVDRGPVVLIRTPYDKTGLMSVAYGACWPAAASRW